MKIEFKNKKVAVLMFCAAIGLMFLGCQTSSYLEETTSQTAFYDYGARNYDPMLGRFAAIEPQLETHYSICPYTYVLDKPIYVDLKGDSILNGKISLFLKKSEIEE